MHRSLEAHSPSKERSQGSVAFSPADLYRPLALVHASLLECSPKVPIAAKAEWSTKPITIQEFASECSSIGTIGSNVDNAAISLRVLGENDLRSVPARATPALP